MTIDSANPDDLLDHAQWLRKLALSLARDEAGAEDLVQDTWAAALTRGPGQAELRIWLARFMERCAQHTRRGELRRKHRESVAAARRPERSDGEVHDAFEAQRALASLVSDLPEPHRTLLMRRYYDGLSAAEIARHAGVPAATVRSQLARAKALLREGWRARHGDSSQRGMSGLLLIAGALPGAFQQGVVMKSTHSGVLAAVCVLAVTGVWGGLALLDPMSPTAEEEQGATALAQLEGGKDEVEGEALRASSESSERHAPVPSAGNDRPLPEVATVVPSRLLARIVDKAGRPIAGAHMEVPGKPGYEPATSDAHGALVLQAQREAIRIWSKQPVSELFHVTAKGHATQFVRAALERDQDTDIGEVTLAPGGPVVGRVIDDSGTPLAGVRVIAGEAALGSAPEDARIHGPDEIDSRVESTTAADGTYRLAGVRAGPSRIWAHVVGRRWAFTQPLDVIASIETRAPDLELVEIEASQSIAGVVLAADGQPLANALVLARGFVPGPNREERATSDAQGRFRVVTMNAGAHQVEAFHPDRLQRPTLLTKVLPGTEDLVLRLAELQWIEVELLDERDGSRLEKPWVRIESNTPFEHADEVPRPKQETLGPGLVRASLPQDSFSIGASAPGYEYVREGLFTPEQMTSRLEIRLKRKPLISGRVTADGSPVAGAIVRTARVMGADFSIQTKGFQTRLFDGGAFPAETGADGRFEHPVSTSMPSGAHVLHVSKEGWAPMERILEITVEGQSDVEIELTRGGALEGNVLLPVGSDTHGALISASNGDGIVLTTRADASGRYRLENLAPGPWEVRYGTEDERYTFTTSGSPPSTGYEGDCVVHEGQTTHFDVDVRALFVPVEGRLTIDGAGANGWTARLEEVKAFDDERVGESVLLDGSGAFILENDGSATRLVLETLGSSTVFARAIRDLDGPALTTSLDLRTGRLTGDAPPSARVNLYVVLADGWTYSARLTIDADGRFSVRLPAGHIRASIAEVKANGSAGWRSAGEVDLVEGEDASIKIE